MNKISKILVRARWRRDNIKSIRAEQEIKSKEARKVLRQLK